MMRWEYTKEEIDRLVLLCDDQYRELLRLRGEGGDEY